MSLDKFKRDTRKTARANGITIKMLKREYVITPDDNFPCGGYFNDVSQELSVATKGPEWEWVAILVHESCHMDQYIENRFLWDKCSPAYEIFSNWLNNEKEVSEEIITEAIQDIIRLELDCERRALEKIKRYELNLDIPTYIQCANICLYGYLFFYEKKRWCNDILDKRSVMSIAPKRFRQNYFKIPDKIHRAMRREYERVYAA